MNLEPYTTSSTDSFYFDSAPSIIGSTDEENDVQQTSILSSNYTSTRPLLSHQFDSQQAPWHFDRKSPTLIEYETNDPVDTSAISTSYYQSSLRFDTDHQTSTACLPLPLEPVDVKAYPIKGVPVNFPFAPYQAQVQMMSKIIEALQKQQHAVLESPTGSGKSLAMLCGALAWLEKEKGNRNMEKAVNLGKLEKLAENDMHGMDFMDCADIDEDPQETNPKPLPRIFVGSRTHRQVAQLVSELKQRTAYRPRMAVLGSRDQYCIHHEVMKSSNKQEDCSYLTDHHNCRFRNHTDRLTKDPRIRQGGPNEIWDIEDLVELGKHTGGCPYYASRDIAETAELIICPYNYLIDPMIRKAMSINLDGNIIILDEAHNIENVSRESGTFELDSDILKFIVMELGQIIQNQYVVPAHGILLTLIDRILAWMYDPSHHFESEDDNRQLHILIDGDEIKETLYSRFGINASSMASIFHPALELAIKHADSMKTEKRNNPDDMTADEESDTLQQSQKTNRTHLSATNLNRFEGLFMVLDYALNDSMKGIADYRMVLMKKVDMTLGGVGQNWDRKIGFWCMNPAVVFRDIAQKAHSIILTSGTLTPVTTFEAELGAEFPIHLEANHVIKPSQVLVQNIPYGPNRNSLKGVYSTTSKPGYQDDLGEAIASICEAVPFGVLVFVTSYSLLDKLCARWKSTGLLGRIKRKKHFMIEPRGGSAESFDKVLKKFYACIKEAENGMGSHDGAVFLAVYRGKVSEGIDFNNNFCRAVVATGIPYPMWKDTKVMLKRTYNDGRWRENNAYLTGDQWYNIQAFRAVNQALGRCIRHRNDWGSILLLEERFLDDRNTQHLSKWIRQLCISRTDNFETIMADLGDFNRGRLQQELESLRINDDEELVARDEHQHGQQLLDDEDDDAISQQQNGIGMNQSSLSSMDTDTIDLCSEYHDALDELNQHNMASTDSLEVISISSSPPGSPTPTPASAAPSLSPSPPSCANYSISCKKCDRPLLSWPPLPITASIIHTHLHYFTKMFENDMEQQSQIDEPVAEILEVNYVFCMEYEKRYDHNRVPAYDRLNGSKQQEQPEVQDVQWDPIDGMVYRPYITECCNQVIGADILTTTLGACEANTDLIGKLWLLKELIQVSISDGGDIDAE